MSTSVTGMERRYGFDLERAEAQALDVPARALPPVQGLMPFRVDLRPDCSPIADQGELGSCTAFAVGQGAREYLQRTRGETVTPLSPLFLYYETRRIRNALERDSGATVADAMKAIAGAGVARESTWPYNVEAFAKKPPTRAYVSAGAWRFTSGIRLAGLEDIKRALARKQPVVFGMRIDRHFRDLGSDGMLRSPREGDVIVGGHAVMAVGYDDEQRVLIIRNSFGAAWGDGGHFYMPYDYAAAPELVLDIWTAS